MGARHRKRTSKWVDIIYVIFGILLILNAIIWGAGVIRHG